MIEQMPFWLVFIIAFFIFLSGFIILISGIGYLFIKDSFVRMHLSSLVMSGGILTIALASVGYFSWTHSLRFIKLFLIVFLTLCSNPIGSMMLAAVTWYKKKQRNLK